MLYWRSCVAEVWWMRSMWQVSRVDALEAERSRREGNPYWPMAHPWDTCHGWLARRCGGTHIWNVGTAVGAYVRERQSASFVARNSAMTMTTGKLPRGARAPQAGPTVLRAPGAGSLRSAARKTGIG